MTTFDGYVRFIPAGVGSIHNPRWAPFERDGFTELLGGPLPPMPSEDDIPFEDGMPFED